MSQADKRLATDTTLQATNTALGLLGKDATLQATNTALGLLGKDATLQATNTALGLLGKDASLLLIKAAIEALPNATQAAADNANAAAANCIAAIASLGALVASTYSDAATYDLDDYTFQDNKLYRCVSPILTAEEWTAAHWQEVKLGDDVTEIINTLYNIAAVRNDSGKVLLSETSGVDTLGNMFPVAVVKKESGKYCYESNGRVATGTNASYDYYVFRIDPPARYFFYETMWWAVTDEKGEVLTSADPQTGTPSSSFSSAGYPTAKYFHLSLLDISTPNGRPYFGINEGVSQYTRSNVMIPSLHVNGNNFGDGLFPVALLEQFTTDHNILPFCEVENNRYYVGLTGSKVQRSYNPSYRGWMIPVEQKTYFMTSVTWWALTDAENYVLAGSGLEGNTITSLNVASYPTAKWLYYSNFADSPYVSVTQNDIKAAFRIEGLEAPNRNVFDIPSFTFVTGKAWPMYFAGAWLRDAEYKRTYGGYQQFDDRFTYRSTSAGDIGVTVKTYDSNFDETGSLYILEHFAEPNYRNLRALFIGDSTINDGRQTQNVLNAFAAHDVTCTLIGTRGSGDNKHEGRSGWSAADYMTAGRDGVTNPFYNPTSGTFDFSYYMQELSVAAPDFVFIQLGINDMFSAPIDEAGFETYYNTYKTNMLKIIESIHTWSVTPKIVVNLIPMPNSSVAAFNTLYGTNYFNWERRYVDIMANHRLIKDLPDYVIVSPHNLILNPSTDINDDVHPNASGYAILGEFDADIMFAN